jgi:hypothetical protein
MNISIKKHCMQQNLHALIGNDVYRTYDILLAGLSKQSLNWKWREWMVSSSKSDNRIRQVNRVQKICFCELATTAASTIRR